MSLAHPPRILGIKYDTCFCAANALRRCSHCRHDRSAETRRAQELLHARDTSVHHRVRRGLGQDYVSICQNWSAVLSRPLGTISTCFYKVDFTVNKDRIQETGLRPGNTAQEKSQCALVCRQEKGVLIQLVVEHKEMTLFF